MTVKPWFHFSGRVIPTLVGLGLMAFVIAAAISPNIAGSAPAQTACPYGACPVVNNSPGSGLSALELGGIFALAVVIALVAGLLLMRSRRPPGGAAAAGGGAAGGAAAGAYAEGPPAEWSGPTSESAPTVPSSDGWQIGKEAAAGKSSGASTSKLSGTASGSSPSPGSSAGSAPKGPAGSGVTPAASAAPTAPSAAPPGSGAGASAGSGSSSGSVTDAELLATAGASAAGGAAIGAAVASDRRKKGATPPTGPGGAPAAGAAGAAAEPNIDSLMEELDRIGRDILKKDREKAKSTDGSGDEGAGGDETAS
ncbi:MAG: hypothetical protein L3K03_02050 [Thermoplasmata archaeon]|nr:hypothetical protein [Thermoplasmata archaeon]